MVVVLKCRTHGDRTEEQCYYSETKSLKKGFRYRCKECYIGYSLNKSLEKKQETLQRIKDWKRENRDKINANVREDYKKNPEKHKKWKDNYLANNYEHDTDRRAAARHKLTIEQYHGMIKDQQNKCAICNEYETRVINGKFCRLCVDHDHKTGKIRGLLCHDCNTSLGKFEDNIQRLQSAIDYLKKQRDL